MTEEEVVLLRAILSYVSQQQYSIAAPFLLSLVVVLTAAVIFAATVFVVVSGPFDPASHGFELSTFQFILFGLSGWLFLATFHFFSGLVSAASARLLRKMYFDKVLDGGQVIFCP